MAALKARPDGTKSDAFLVHLGGGMGDDAGFGRKVKGVKVFAEDSADYLATLVTRYRRDHSEGDTFRSYVAALDADQLARFAAPEARR